MTPQEIFDGLAAPFASEQIDWRVGPMTKDQTKGMALAYIDARTVMDRFDAVCGPAGWMSEHFAAGGERMGCKISVWFDGAGWVHKTDGGGESDMEAEKGAFSISLRRAAVSWGVGRYLYDLESPWVQIEHKRIVPAEIPKLNELHDRMAQRLGWGGNHARAVGNAIRIVDSAIHHFVSDPSQAVEFQKANEGVLAALPKCAREHVLDKLSRVGAPLRAAE